MTLLFAAACGLIIGNIYYVQPLASPINAALGLPRSSTGLIVTLTQVGYALGLLLLVPLCDLLENRRTIVIMIVVGAGALAIAGVTHAAPVFLLAALVIGLSTTAVQMLVPFAASLAPVRQRGQVVGRVVSGVMLGIMASRPLASFIASLSSWQMVFLSSAGLMVVIAAILAITLRPRMPQIRLSYLGLLRSMATLIVTQPVLRTRALCQLLLFASFNLFWTVVPPLLAAAPFNLQQRDIGLFALAGITGALASPVAGTLADWQLSRPSTIWGIVAAGAGYAITCFPIGDTTAALVTLAIAAVFINCGVALNFVIGLRAIYSLEPEQRSRLNGLFGACAFGGGAIGSSLGGWSYAHGGWPVVCVFGAAFSALALAYFLVSDTDR